jgi:Ca2+-binding EF-hand superfamily protein
LIFRRFDKDSDGLLRFSDFSKIINPTSLEYSNLLKERSPVYIDSEDDLTLETRRIFKNLLKLCI